MSRWILRRITMFWLDLHAFIPATCALWTVGACAFVSFSMSENITWWNEHVCKAWWPADWGVIDGELKLQVKSSISRHHLTQTQCWENRNRSNLINSMKQNGDCKQKIDPTWFYCCIAEVKWWKDDGVLTTTSLLTSIFARHRPQKWVLLHSIW